MYGGEYRKMKQRFQDSRNALWWFSCALFLTLFAMVILKYLYFWSEISVALLIAYPVALTLFIVVKEATRHQGEFPEKLGQIFVVLWSVLFLVMEIATPILNKIMGFSLVIPQELFPIWVEVMVIFGASEIAKNRFLIKRKNGSDNNNDNKNKETS